MHTWQIILLIMVSINTIVNCCRLLLEMKRHEAVPNYLGGKNEL
jgi:hypothetical protein